MGRKKNRKKEKQGRRRREKVNIMSRNDECQEGNYRWIQRCVIRRVILAKAVN